MEWEKYFEHCIIINISIIIIIHLYLFVSSICIHLPWLTPSVINIYILWLFNIAMENDPFIDDFPSYKPPFIVDNNHGYVSHNQMVNPIKSHEKPSFSYGFPMVYLWFLSTSPVGSDLPGPAGSVLVCCRASHRAQQRELPGWTWENHRKTIGKP